MRRYMALVFACARLSFPGAAVAQSGDWSDVPSARQQAEQQQQEQQQAELEQQQARRAAAPPPLPTMKQLVNQAMVRFDPSRETPQAYMARMKTIENKMKEVNAAQARAAADPPIYHLPPGTILPGMSSYQVQTDNFSSNPNDRGFFGGITPEQAAAGMKMPLQSQHNGQIVSPEWAKQKAPGYEYVDGVKHYGKQDSMGFF